MPLANRVLIVLPLAVLLIVSFTLPAEANRLSDVFESLQREAKQSVSEQAATEKDPKATKKGLQRATFGGGCFWCTEAVFEELRGVKRVVSGYSGGRVKNPTYQLVLTKLTGHAEVIQLEFDPEVISYATLLEVFWRTHDPTTKNQQGPDYGPQYRSVIFYHNDEQKELATRFKRQLNKTRAYGKPVVTEIAKFDEFYTAEQYHQNYFKGNPRAGYCQRIIKPKVKKFRRMFADYLKQNPKAQKGAE